MKDLLKLLEFSILNSAAGSAEYALFATAQANGVNGGVGGSVYSGNTSYWGSLGRGEENTLSGNMSSDVALNDLFEMYCELRYAD